MSPRRTLVVARRVVAQIIADRRTLALLLVVPVVIVLVLGLVLRAGTGTVRVLLVAPAGAAQIVQAAAAGPVQLLGDVDVGLADAAVALDDVDAGRADAAIFLVVDAGDLAVDRVVLEGTDVQANRIAQTFATTLAGAGRDGAASGLPQPSAAVQYPVEHVRCGPELDLVDTLAPALIAFFIFFFVFLLTTVALVRERRSGTLERLMATPLRRIELVTGYSLGLGLYALIQALLVTGLSVVALQVDVFGSLAVVFLVAALLVAGAVSLGILASGYARNEFQAVQFIPIVIVPQALLSGAFWPLDAMPGWVQGLARAFPLTYAQEAMREVMVAGRGLADFDVYGRVLVLAGFGALFIVLGAMGLRRQTA